jgi:hypothetical protein
MASLVLNGVACGCVYDNGDITGSIVVTHRLTQSFGQHGDRTAFAAGTDWEQGS